MEDYGIPERLMAVRERIANACAKAGRLPEEVRLVTVSKTYPPEMVAVAAAHGCHCFGESRVYEALPKIEASAGHLEWHFIGHLQRNKVPPVLAAFAMIHAVDSLRLLERIETVAETLGVRAAICLEVNVSGESSKYGFAPDDVPAVLDAVNQMSAVDVRGVMTMAPFYADPDDTRPVFRKLRQLRDQWAAASGFELGELSMGMSNDFDVAVEEGSTMVRVGSAIFGRRL